MNIKKWFRTSFCLKHAICIIITIICIVFALLLNSDDIVSLTKYQSFIKSRNYNYSILISKDVGENTYAFYGKSIIFATDNKLENTINSIVFMNLNNKKTSADFLYNFDINSLKENEVAISFNIANKNNLKEGSIIYSKNRVTSKTNSYAVKIILPEIYGINQNDINKNKGIIVVGKSDEYLSNIQADYIYFYYEDYSLINTQGANIVGELNYIGYTKTALNKIHIYKTIITSFLVGLVCIITFILLSKFNVNIYIKKKEFGISKLYYKIFFDYLIYYLLILILSILMYCVLKLTNISIEQMLILGIELTLAFIITILCHKMILKRR